MNSAFFRRRTVRGLSAALGATAVLAACSGPEPLTTVPAPPSTTQTDSACPAPGIKITAGAVDGAMGLRALGILLTNCGTADYTANGYPVVRVLDANRQPLDITVGNGSEPVSAPDSYDMPPQPVTVRPGEQVTARVLWRNTVTDSTVNATNGQFLEIAAAAGEPPQLVTPAGGIDLGNTGRLAVNPWAVRT